MDIKSKLIVVVVLVFPIVASADDISEKLSSGTTCFVEFNMNHPPCNGTLQRAVVYKVTYRVDIGQWKVYGKICDKAEHQSAMYPGPYPGAKDIRKISMWGTIYEYSEDGKLRQSRMGENIGTVICP